MINSFHRAAILSRDEHIRRKCGNDAVQYLQFQRYLISYAVVICLISLGVILPINFMGSEYDASKFARTTISNLKAGYVLLTVTLRSHCTA